MAMLMSALRTFASRSDSAIETPDSQILHHDQVSQPGDEIDDLTSIDKEVGCARDKHETTSEVVVEAPERHDVLEHCVFKCFGAYPNMQSAFISTSAIVEKHWAKKSQILVHPVELKQAALISRRASMLLGHGGAHPAAIRRRRSGVGDGPRRDRQQDPAALGRHLQCMSTRRRTSDDEPESAGRAAPPLAAALLACLHGTARPHGGAPT